MKYPLDSWALRVFEVGLGRKDMDGEISFAKPRPLREELFGLTGGLFVLVVYLDAERIATLEIVLPHAEYTQSGKRVKSARILGHGFPMGAKLEVMNSGKKGYLITNK